MPFVVKDFGGSGASTRYACGFLGYDCPFDPVLNTLPRLLHVMADRPGSELPSRR